MEPSSGRTLALVELWLLVLEVRDLARSLLRPAPCPAPGHAPALSSYWIRLSLLDLIRYYDIRRCLLSPSGAHLEMSPWWPRPSLVER